MFQRESARGRRVAAHHAGMGGKGTGVSASRKPMLDQRIGGHRSSLG